MASAFYRSDPRDQSITDTGSSGRLYRQQGVCKLGKIFHRTAGEPDTGQSVMGIFQEETAGYIFILKDNECG